MSYKIYPYQGYSESARILKEELNAMIIKTEGSRYRHRWHNIVINWGNSTRIEQLSGVSMLNNPEAVAIASNKLFTFEALQLAEVPAVPFTVDTDLAQEWVDEGGVVFVRHQLHGHSGAGIQVVRPDEHSAELDAIAGRLALIGQEYLSGQVMDELLAVNPSVPAAPLYTRGIENYGEYRVHVFGGEIILYQKKSRKVDEDGEVVTPEGGEVDVRNLASNWIYRTGNLNRLERIEELAISAITALGLDFGAVDIIMNEDKEVMVLEINSAPGISNTETREAYVTAIKNYENI